MKKKACIAIILASAVFLSCTGFVIPSENEVQSMSIANKSTEQLCKETVRKIVSSEGICDVIEVKNLDRYTSALKSQKPNITNYELGKEVLLAMGSDEEEIKQLPEEKVLEAAEYKSCRQTISYYKTNDADTENGTAVQTTRMECMNNLMQKEEANSITATASQKEVAMAAYANPIRETTLEHGWFRIILTTIHTGSNSYGKTFTVRSTVEWLSMPTFLLTDAIAIASNGNFDNDYDIACLVAWTGWCSNHRKICTAQAINRPDDGKTAGIDTQYQEFGMGATIDLIPDWSCQGHHFPNDTTFGRDFLLKIMAFYGIVIPNGQSAYCYTEYAHARVLPSSISISIAPGGGISFSAAPVTNLDPKAGKPIQVYASDYK